MSDKITTWDEFKKLIDNPDLPDNVKVHLIESVAADDDSEYGLSAANQLDGYSDDKLKELKDKYKVSDDQVDNYFSAGGDSFDDVVSSAKKAATDDAAHNKDVKNSKDKLADITTGAGKGDFGGAGAKNSNDILDQGLPALKYFSDFLPLYAKVGSEFRSGDKNQAVRDMETIYKRYDEQRDIPFDKFVDESTKLTKAADAARDTSGDMGTQLSTLFDHWTGSAAKGAQDTYTRFNKDTEDNVVAHLKSVSDAVRTAQAGVAKAVTNKADSTLEILHASDPNYSNGMLGGKSVDEWSVTIDIANGAEDDDTLRKAAEAWDVHIDQDNCSGSLTSDTKATIRKKAQQVTGDILVKTIADDWSAYIKMCDDTKSAVDKLWKTLNDKIKELPEQPYAAEKKPDGSKPDPKDDPDTNNKKDPTPNPKGDTSPPPAETSPAGAPPVNQPPPNPTGKANGSAPPPPPTPGLSKVGNNIPAPNGTNPAGVTQGSGPPPPPGPGKSTVGPNATAPPPPPPTPTMPDLSGIGSQTPGPERTTNPSSAHTGSAPASPPTPRMPKVPSSQQPPELSLPTPTLPPPTGTGPKTAGPATPGARHSPGARVVRRVPLPGGGTATIGKPDAHGNKRLTIHEPNGKTKQYELDFGKQGDTGKTRGVQTIHPDAHGRMVIHDGHTTLTVGKANADGVNQVTVHARDGATHRFDLVPPETDPKRFDAPHAAPVSAGPAMPGGGHSSVQGFGGAGAHLGSSAAAAGGAPMPTEAGQTSVRPGAGATSGAAPRVDGAPAAAGGPAPGAPQDGQAGGGAMAPMSPGGAQGKGGDSERKSGKWGMAGNLFDDLSTQRSERLQSFLEGKPPKRDGGQQ